MKARRKSRHGRRSARRTAVKVGATGGKKIRLLIADDHVLVREGLAATIGRQHDMLVVNQAANGREAVDLWKECRPDIALVDLRMPDGDGVTVIKEIRDLDTSARIII